MATPFREDVSLTDEQRQDFALAASFLEMSKSSAWKNLQEYLQSEVDAAQEELLGEVKGDRDRRDYLTTRWQQRLAVKRGIEQYVESWIHVHENLTEDSKPSEEQ